MCALARPMAKCRHIDSMHVTASPGELLCTGDSIWCAKCSACNVACNGLRIETIQTTAVAHCTRIDERKQSRNDIVARLEFCLFALASLTYTGLVIASALEMDHERPPYRVKLRKSK